ncbi:hypothetical protein HDU89_001308 [Geranomyces variabilis]|nr:hypothetical protein HDU89_001308 [Geranomyces variabilis]
MLVGTDNNDSSNAITRRQNSLSLHHHRQRIRTLCCPPSPSSTPHPLLTELPHRASNGFSFSLVAIQTCLAGAAEYTRVKISQRAELLDILKLKNKAFWKAKFAEEEDAVAAATVSEASPVAPGQPPPLPSQPIVISDAQISPPPRDKGKARVLAKQGPKKDASSSKQPAAAKKTVGTRKEVAEQSKKAKSNKRKSNDATNAAGKTSTKRASRPKETEAPDGMAEMSLAPVLLAEAAAAAAAAAATSTNTLSAEAAAAASSAQNAVQSSAPPAQSDAQTVTVAAGDGNASSSTAKAANPPPKNPRVAKKTCAQADKLGAAKTPAVQAPVASGAPPPAGQDMMDVDKPAAGASKKNRRKRRSTKHKDAQAAGGGGGDEEEEPAVAITTLRTNKGKRSHPGVLDPQAEPSAKRRKKGERSSSSHGAVEAVTDGNAPAAAAAAASNNNVEPVKPEISMQELEVRLAVCETLLAQLADPRALHAAIVDVTPTCDVAFTSWDCELLTLTYPPPISHTVQTILHLALIIVPRPPTTTTTTKTTTTTTRHPLHNTRDVLLAATATANNPLPSTPRAARLMAAFTCDAGVAFQIAAAPVLRAMEAVGREIEDAVMGIARWSGLARGKSGCSDGDGDSAAGAATGVEEEEGVGDEVALALALDEKPAPCVEDEARQQRLVTRLGLLRKLYRHLTQMAVPGAGGPG